MSEEMLVLKGNLTYSETSYWYGATRRPLHLDVICPKKCAKKRPVILWFCGGAFQQMDHHVWLPTLHWYAEQGFTVVSAEYRVGVPGRWPAPIEDGWNAIRYIRENAEEFCADGGKIAVMGESAGAYIATALGVGLKKPENMAPVRAAVDYYGVSSPADMSAFERERGHDSITSLMGGAPETQPEKYLQADICSHVAKDSAPCLILHGTKDERVPIEQSKKLCEAYRQAGVRSEMVTVRGAVHGDERFYRKSVKAKVCNFLNETLLEGDSTNEKQNEG